ncbi:hypothetical protein GGR53DRAFT_521814 [Hypoxylon sp. FL1150]|nr:hypothetical protein GGR53DRAFT_521814 [Hypoxylon sp. FL1150]
MPFQEPNEVDPPPPTEVNNTHKVYSIAIGCILMGIVGSVFVSARLWYRVRSRTLGVDDYAIIPAFCLLTITWLYPAVSSTIRVSILLIYYRIFAGGYGKVFKRVIWVLIGIQVAFALIFPILPAFICKPLKYAWHPLERPQVCTLTYWINLHLLSFSISLALDIILLVFPVFPVWMLQTSRKKRIGVAVMFMLGALAGILSVSVFNCNTLVVRPCTPSHELSHGVIGFEYLLSRYIPVQFDNYGVAVWIPSQLEPTLALMGGSLPAVYPLWIGFSSSVFKKISERWSSPAQSGDVQSKPNLVTFGSPRKFHKLDGSQIELQPQTSGIHKDATALLNPMDCTLSDAAWVV